jgi:hypothetical protein
MKSARWLALLLVILIATLIFIRRNKPVAAPPTPVASSGETVQAVPADSALDAAEVAPPD